jgi:hypothetical protein
VATPETLIGPVGRGVDSKDEGGVVGGVAGASDGRLGDGLAIDSEATDDELGATEGGEEG